MGNAGSEHQDSYQGSSSNRHPSIPEHTKHTSDSATLKCLIAKETNRLHTHSQ